MSGKTSSTDKSPREAQGPESKGWRAYRQEIRFLALFIGILGVGFTLISVNAVNDHVIEPFTAGIARVSGYCLQLIDSTVRMQGTEIHNSRFAVNIQNGCNGVEAMIIFLAAVLAFPASWGARTAGLLIGVVVIQLVNLVRVIALFLTGVHFPDFFDDSHTVVWQTVVILCGVLLWIFWANRFALPRPVTASSE